jgi:hypothetical protein
MQPAGSEEQIDRSRPRAERERERERETKKKKEQDDDAARPGVRTIQSPCSASTAAHRGEEAFMDSNQEPPTTAAPEAERSTEACFLQSREAPFRGGNDVKCRPTGAGAATAATMSSLG